METMRRSLNTMRTSPCGMAMSREQPRLLTSIAQNPTMLWSAPLPSSRNKTPKQASLVQLKTLRLIIDEAKKLIDAFLQQDPEEGRVQRRVWQLAPQKPMHTSSSMVVLLSCSRSSLINSLRSEPVWRRRK